MSSEDVGVGIAVEEVERRKEIPARVPDGMTRYTVSAYGEGGWNDVLVVDLPARSHRKAAVTEAIRRGRIEVPDDLSCLKVRVLDQLNADLIPVSRRESDPLADLVIG